MNDRKLISEFRAKSRDGSFRNILHNPCLRYVRGILYPELTSVCNSAHKILLLAFNCVREATQQLAALVGPKWADGGELRARRLWAGIIVKLQRMTVHFRGNLMCPYEVHHCY
jgi:hypothetical protein